MSENSDRIDSTSSRITADALRRWPLPSIDEQGDKNNRGSVLIVGGALETPGAVVLAATAALRSGVGRLRIATCQSHASAIGVAVPEARVFALPETTAGEIDPAAAPQLAALANGVDAVLLGPGMIDKSAISALLERLLPGIAEPTLVLDAGALTAWDAPPPGLRGRAGSTIITPHGGEMASMLGRSKAEVDADPPHIARRAARELDAVVVLKGPVTWIAGTDSELYRYEEGQVGLATSGSGDTLSGIIAGLAARAASPAQAASWGVYLHGEAGNRLTRHVGRVGFLARELPGQIPHIIADLTER